MKKFVFSFCIILIIMSANVGSGSVYAKSEGKPKPAEEFYTEFGYETVEDALKEIEKHFNQSLELPTRVPPLTFTHHFGRFENLAGDMNAALEVKFIHEDIPENHYKIDVRPVKHKIPIRERDVIDVFPLKYGQEAAYFKISGFYALVFEQDNWQYILSVDKRVSDKVTSEELVQIANSIHTFYQTEGAK